MKKFFWTALLLLVLPLIANAGGLFVNTIDDLLSVKKLDAKQATLEGSTKGLKEGDSVYFVRSPFKFTVTSVTGNTATIALPEKHSLAVGNTLMRKEDNQVKKALDTENRLKQALEE